MDNYRGLINQINDSSVLQYNRWLEDIIKFTDNVWKTKMMPWFTSHDTYHSREIIFILGQILKPLQKYNDYLNPHELFIIEASAYLHDIGMQYMKLNQTDIENLKTNDYNVIRKKHAEISFEIIMKITDPIHKRDDLHLPVIGEAYLPLIAYISKGHSTEYFDEVINFFDDPSFNMVNNREIRGQLLTALLMIADELDLSRKRVDFFDITKFNLSSHSLMHWFKHYYVTSVSVEDRKVHIDMMFPESSDHYRLLIDLIRDKLQEQIKKVNPILRKSSNGILYFEEDDCVIINEKVNNKYSPRELPDEVYNELKLVLKKNLINK